MTENAMEKLLKLTDMSKYFTAIQVANNLRNAVYATVIVLMGINIIRLFKGISKS